MKVQIKTDNKYHHDDGLVNGMIVEVEFMGKHIGSGDFYRVIGINHRLFLTSDDFIELTND
jgi:hypothetical protein